MTEPQQPGTGTHTEKEPPRPGGSPFENFGRRVEEQLGAAGPRIEEEVRRIIDYLNDEVVPEVRRQSSTALRYASIELGRLAEHLERRTDRPAASTAGESAPR